jgi:(p)ppGpp synthase/HD superfamily hydrolase
MLTDRFSEALTYAERLHRRQFRKGNDIPYVAHLLAVCSLVLEWGGQEDTAIASLLHDAAEDQGGEATLAEIRRRFGDRVADAVLACSDSLTATKEAKAPWRERKLRHVQKLRTCVPDAILITAADKLHNLSALIRDVRRDGPQTMSRFNAEPAHIIWYHREVVAALRMRDECPPQFVGEIEIAISTLEKLLGMSESIQSSC